MLLSRSISAARSASPRLARRLATATTAPTSPSPADLAARVAAAITPQTVSAYARDGAVVVRNLFTADEIAALAAGIDNNVANPSPRAKVASSPTDPGWFFEDFCNWPTHAAYRSFIARSPASSAAGALMASNTARLYHDHLLVKEPGTRQRTPWHQDQPYYNIEGQQSVSMWIPVDKVDQAATLEFVAGSHRGPWLMPRTFMDNEAKWFPEGSLADLPDIEADRGAFEIKKWALEPGDMVAFHMLTLHASAGATARRRAFSLRFIGDDVRHAPRRWKTSPDFPGLADELAPGAVMEHPLFPVVWSRDGGQVAI
ncbi:uncharacterized protein LOC62_01G000340 [Vanrija pseudolonga]|uniref:Phytanoyl-CoA dioxygenase n=1 Tax=Vanrija pseudolonga TaxID=143232 RepID=A0AAF0XZE3_9TREE|nr:hypothetical protein LOC62_01G000340 [Vanrija pseudolonga]